MEIFNNKEKLNDCKNGLLYIKISFDNKQFAKNIGGIYNSILKLWYVDYDVSRTDLENLINMKANDKFIAIFPKYLNKSTVELNRQEVISMLDSYTKLKYCCCCGLALVAMGSRRKNGAKIFDWSTRNSHKNCYKKYSLYDNFKSFDVQTGKNLIHL